MKPRSGIVQVIFHPVGGRRFVEPLARALIADGQACEMWVEPVKGTEDFLKGFTVPVKICPSKLGFNPLKAAATFLTLLKNLRERNPLILHAHLFRGAFLPLLAARLSNVPVRIYHNHGVSYVGYRGVLRFVLMLIEGTNCRLATHVVTVNETLRPALRAVAPKGQDILVFGPGSICGLDVSEYAASLDEETKKAARNTLGINENDLVLLYIGRPHVHKGFPAMLEAFTRRFSMRTDVTLLVCGCGPEDVKRAMPNAPENIRALGYLQNLHPVYRASDAILLPSLYEGLPYSLLEGAAQGCAMIASNIPGPDALIAEGKNGLFVKAGDVDDLVRALDQVAINRDQLNIMGKAAFEKAQEFRREKVIGPYLGFIREVIAKIDSRFHPGVAVIGWRPDFPATGAPMNEAEVIEICRQAIIVMLKVVGPILLAGLVVGVVVSLIQAVTQIQEMTLSFIPKMLVIFGITIWLLPFMMSTLGGFAQSMSDKIVQVGQSND